MRKYFVHAGRIEAQPKKRLWFWSGVLTRALNLRAFLLHGSWKLQAGFSIKWILLGFITGATFELTQYMDGLIAIVSHHILSKQMQWSSCEASGTTLNHVDSLDCSLAHLSYNACRSGSLQAVAAVALDGYTSLCNELPQEVLDL